MGALNRPFPEFRRGVVSEDLTPDILPGLGNARKGIPEGGIHKGRQPQAHGLQKLLSGKSLCYGLHDSSGGVKRVSRFRNRYAIFTAGPYSALDSTHSEKQMTSFHSNGHARVGHNER